jgi:hypothetical protein
MQFLIIALIAFLIEWMYLFLVHKLFDGISRVIDACKYLTPSNQESRYITEVEPTYKTDINFGLHLTGNHFTSSTNIWKSGTECAI